MRDWTDEEERAGRAAFDHYRLEQGDRVSWDWPDMQDFEKRPWVERARRDGLQPAADPPARTGTSSVRFAPEFEAAIVAHLRREEAGDGSFDVLNGQPTFRCHQPCDFCDALWRPVG